MKKKEHPPIRAVIFDMDGTIISTEQIWDDATKKPLYDRGHLEFPEKYHEARANLSGGGLSFWAELVKEHFPAIEDESHVLIEEVVQNARDALAQKVPFIDGFEDFHANVRNHDLKSGIATNADETSFKQIIKSMEFENYFGEHLYCVDHVQGKAKPDPALFLYTAERLGVPPDQCLVIEDSIFGFEAARAAGMRCIGIKNIFNQGGHDHVLTFVENYREAHDLLKDLARQSTSTPADDEPSDV